MASKQNSDIIFKQQDKGFYPEYFVSRICMSQVRDIINIAADNFNSDELQDARLNYLYSSNFTRVIHKYLPSDVEKQLIPPQQFSRLVALGIRRVLDQLSAGKAPTEKEFSQLYYDSFGKLVSKLK